ncbi:MAG TPA: hypothetical protein PKA27_06945 [Fimbriimonadaceae bacterium]|nr:hypothetical protein [Fimbriimonadaceae bacterium]
MLRNVERKRRKLVIQARKDTAWKWHRAINWEGVFEGLLAILALLVIFTSLAKGEKRGPYESGVPEERRERW